MAQDWLEAWNRRDLEAIMAHCAEDVEFWAETVVLRWGVESGRLEGRAALGRH